MFKTVPTGYTTRKDTPNILYYTSIPTHYYHIYEQLVEINENYNVVRITWLVC